RPVVVHGGGPQISAKLTELGIESEFRGGFRVTTEETIAVVREVLAGEISRDLAALIDEHGELATAIPGDTEGLFSGVRRGAVVDGVEVDLGLVGDVSSVDASSILAALHAGKIPVVASVAVDSANPGQI